MNEREETTANSNKELARRLISGLAANGTPDPTDLTELIHRATSSDASVAAEASRDFFIELIEPLCDAFDGEATAKYVSVFARAVEQMFPTYTAQSLMERYARIRRPQAYDGSPRRVCVLSRVTLGADIAVSSAVIGAVKRRFPEAEICFVGPAKNAELFAADDRVNSLISPYSRSGLLRDRLEASMRLGKVLQGGDTLVIDPDSRLSQLGIIPVCDEERYLFFESRTYGEPSSDALPVLTAGWLKETIGLDAAPFLAPERQPYTAEITVSLGVGDNPQKRIQGGFETRVIAALLATGKRVMVDRGVGGEETERVNRIADRLGNPANLVLHDGSFASFAAHILQSQLYFGYDSAGQHAAAAGAVPLVTVFAGYATEKTFERWKPWGSGRIWTVKISDENRHSAEARALSAISEAVEAMGSRPGQEAAARIERVSP